MLHLVSRAFLHILSADPRTTLQGMVSVLEMKKHSRKLPKAGEQRQERWERRRPVGSPVQPDFPRAKHGPSAENMLSKRVEWASD